jgi:hypothetical protein
VASAPQVYSTIAAVTAYCHAQTVQEEMTVASAPQVYSTLASETAYCHAQTVPEEMTVASAHQVYSQWWASLHDVITALKIGRYQFCLKR